jgi:hypothetical protein
MMAEMHTERLWDRLVEAAKASGRRGVAFAVPIEPEEHENGLTVTLFMFRATLPLELGNDPRVLSVYTGISAEQEARRRGHVPRMGAL